jgi:regulator of sigma E protease
MGILTQAFGLILSLSILVILHEFGHFAFARLFKTRVEKFYLFFNPWFELFKFKKGETEYGIGWLPLGGYVKISGMIDESMDKEALKQEPQPYEFRSKPAWQRLLIMIGGVLVNFLLALVIYSMILFVWGEEYITANNVKYGYDYHQIAKEAGFQDGDKIIQVGDQVIDNYKDIVPALLIDNPENVTLIRNEETIVLNLPADFTKKVISAEVKNLISIRVPFVVDTLIAGMPGAEAGLKTGDRIMGINGVSTPFFTQFNEEKSKYSSSSIQLEILRDNESLILPVTLKSDAVLGIYNRGLDYHFDISRTEYSFFAAIPAGINLGVEKLSFYVKQMKLVFTKEGASQIGGFGAIGGLFPKSWDWQIFWNMTAFLSLILAFMNILPIPALDGGHVAFLLYELVTRRKPGDKFLEYAQITGMVLLLTLLVYANGNDIYRAVQDWF